MAEVPVGAEVRSPEVHKHFAFAAEGLFRSEARVQYQGWPSGATTDGSSIYTCWRSGDESIDAVGLTYFDFGPEVFPFRLTVSANGTGVSLVLFIGNTDRDTGHPPVLGSKTVLVPVSSRKGRIAEVQLVSSRRQEPISWTRAIEFDVPAE